MRRLPAVLKLASRFFFQTTKAFLPTMLEINHGHIVTVASSLGLFSTAGVEVCQRERPPSVALSGDEHTDTPERPARAREPSAGSPAPPLGMAPSAIKSPNQPDPAAARPQGAPCPPAVCLMMVGGGGDRVNKEAMESSGSATGDRQMTPKVDLLFWSTCQNLVSAHRMRWLWQMRGGLRCHFVEPALIKPCSSHNLQFRACVGVLFCAVCAVAACSLTPADTQKGAERWLPRSPLPHLNGNLGNGEEPPF